MGYTHYWEYHPERLTDSQIETVQQNVVKEITSFLEETIVDGEKKWKLKDGLGNWQYYPEFQKDGCVLEYFDVPRFELSRHDVWGWTSSIHFNGTEENDLGHEDFYFDFKQPKKFAFCKTARKPYDMLVMLTLLSLKCNFDKFEIYSEGEGLTKDESLQWLNNLKKTGVFKQRIYPFSFSSDGTASEEWLEAIKLYEETFNVGVDVRCIGDLEEIQL